MLVSSLEIFILCSILLHFIEEALISGLCVVACCWDMDLGSNYLAILSGNHFTDLTLQMYRLISPHIVCAFYPDARTVNTYSDQHICIDYTLFCIGYGKCTREWSSRDYIS